MKGENKLNLLNKKWIKFKNKNVKIINKKGNIKIINDTDSHGFLVCPVIFKNNSSIKLHFYGEIINGNGAILQILDFKKIYYLKLHSIQSQFVI